MIVRGAAVIWAALLLFPLVAAGEKDEALERFDLPRSVAGGEVPVSVAPSRLLLGKDVECALSASLPTGARNVRVLAARGSVEGVVVEGGEVRARYRPPGIYLPGLDVVAVLAEEGGVTRFGFAAVQLVGQGQAVIRTRPLAEAVIDIRGVRFGPVKANRHGEATIRVMVPPGTVAGMDGEGSEVDLKVPATGRLFAFTAAAELVAGGSGTDVFSVVLAADGSEAGADVRPAIEASRGSLAEQEPSRAVVQRWHYLLPPDDDASSGDVEIRLALEGEDASLARIALPVVPPVLEPEPEPEPEPAPEPVPEPVPAATSSLSLAPKAGWVTNLGALHALAVSLEIGVRLPVPGVDLGVVLEPGFAWSRTSGVAAAGGDVDLDANTWVVPITLGVAWRVPLGDGFGLSIAAVGGGALAVNTVAGGDLDSLERAFLPAAGGSLAADRRLGPGALLLEARYLWIGGELESMRGRLSILSISLGYRFDLQ